MRCTRFLHADRSQSIFSMKKSYTPHCTIRCTCRHALTLAKCFGWHSSEPQYLPTSAKSSPCRLSSYFVMLRGRLRIHLNDFRLGNHKLPKQTARRIKDSAVAQDHTVCRLCSFAEDHTYIYAIALSFKEISMTMYAESFLMLVRTSHARTFWPAQISLELQSMWQHVLLHVTVCHPSCDKQN